MTSITRYIAGIAFLLALAGCATPNKSVMLSDLFCRRVFGQACPTGPIGYAPPGAIPGPPTPSTPADLNLNNISCDVEFGKVFVTAHVHNDGMGPVPLARSGTSVTATVIATLQSGAIEIAQDSDPSPVGANSDGNTLRPGLSKDWSNYTHVHVYVETDLLNLEQNYSNSALDADVSPTPLPESTSFDQVYCKAPSKQ